MQQVVRLAAFFLCDYLGWLCRYCDTLYGMPLLREQNMSSFPCLFSFLYLFANLLTVLNVYTLLCRSIEYGFSVREVIKP